MKKWIINYNLEIMTAILAIVFCVSIFFWDGLTLAGKALLGFMVLYALHEWEESKFPGGFYDLFFGGFGIEIKVSEARMHLPVAIYILIMLLVWQWILGFVLALIGFVIMEQFFLKTVGLTFIDFRKMAMDRVWGNRN